MADRRDGMTAHERVAQLRQWAEECREAERAYGLNGAFGDSGRMGRLALSYERLADELEAEKPENLSRSAGTRK
jgi:hypothetical protein